MKKEIHPAYGEVLFICSCGHQLKGKSTAGHDIRVDVCSQCHPFYTGKSKMVDTAGRVQRFTERYGRKYLKTNEAGQASDSEQAS